MRKTQTIISLLITSILMLSLISITVSANGVLYSGKLGENIEWTLDDSGLLYIDGVGEINDYISDEAMSLVKEIHISDGISSIYEMGFMGCTELTVITIPSTVKHIGSSAFLGCMYLTDVYYEGSEADWKKINIESGNKNLNNATIHFEMDLPNSDDVSDTQNITIPDLVGTLNYNVKYDETFICTFTPNKSGIYRMTVNGHSENYNERIELLDPNGIEPLNTKGGAEGRWLSWKNDAFFALEGGVEYTYQHTAEEAESCSLNISYHNPYRLSTGTESSYSHSYERSGYECFLFEPTVSGNYSLKFSEPESISNILVWYESDGYAAHDFFEKNTQFVANAGERLYVLLSFYPNECQGKLSVTTISLIEDTSNPTCSHTYTSTSGNICTSCGYEFEPELVEYNKTMYSTINNVAVRNQPYAKGGTLVKKLAKGEAVKVTHYFYNALGSKWYITSDGNYIFGDYLTLTGVQKHTLTFNANGSGVTNLPETAHIQEGVRMAIPGKASGIPERAGYTFIGYSTDKNATTAEYVPGRSIKLTEDTTLYAIWESNSDYTSYRNKINALKKAIGTKDICENQITKITKSDSKYIKSTGNCNVASVVTLLNRNLFYEGRTNEKQFTILNAYSANGCKVLYGPTLDYLRNGKQNSTNQYGYSYSGNTGAWACSRKYTNNSGTTYTVCNQSLSVINKNKGTQTYEEYIASLLNEHPEGICIRKKKGSSGHVCVVTDYEIVNGKYQFYVQDPVDKFTGKYEGSYQYREYGDITSNIDFIAFIK